MVVLVVSLEITNVNKYQLRLQKSHQVILNCMLPNKLCIVVVDGDLRNGLCPNSLPAFSSSHELIS